MRTLGKDKSTPMRGQRRTRKAEYGVCGDWLLVARWKWDLNNEVFTVCMDDGEKLHVAFIYTWEINAVMKAMGSVYSASKHLGNRLLSEAVFKSGKSRLWVHGLLRPDVVSAQIIGITEEQPERLPKIKAPWRKLGGSSNGQPDSAVPVHNPEAETLIRL